MRTALRTAYGIPDELGDSDAERVVSGGISAVVDGEFAVADERFGAFSTVCERQHPNDHVANIEGVVSYQRYDSKTIANGNT